MDQELRFNTLLLEYVSTLSIKKQSSFGINADKYNHILDALKLNKGEACSQGARFKSWALTHFYLHKVGQRLYVYCTSTKKTVATQEEFYDILFS